MMRFIPLLASAIPFMEQLARVVVVLPTAWEPRLPRGRVLILKIHR